jgi:S-adenosylmethionine hydrolase
MEDTNKKNPGLKIVTLTSDWGTDEYYSAAVKGRLYSLIPDVTVIDISHNISTFDVNHGGYVLKNTFTEFPPGTIHIIGVDTEEFAVNDIIQSHLIVKFKGYYFIGADNGIFSILTGAEEPEEIVELTIPFTEVNGKFKYIFSARDRFVYAAAHIANGGALSEIGNPVESFKKVIQPQPTHTNEYIQGTVIHVDPYENVVVNINEKLFYELLQERKFRILFRNYEITSVSKQYSDVGGQSILALFNSAGFLEIAINKGYASSLLGLRLNDMVTIEFIKADR